MLEDNNHAKPQCERCFWTNLQVPEPEVELDAKGRPKRGKGL